MQITEGYMYYMYTPISHTTEQCYMHITTQIPLLVNTQSGSNLYNWKNEQILSACIGSTVGMVQLHVWVWCSYMYWASKVTQIGFP